MKPTIIYISSDSNKSGVPVHILSLVNRLKEEYDIKVICSEGWLSEELKSRVVEVYVVSIRLLSVLMMRSYLAKFSGGNLIIHSHGVKAGLVGRIAAIGLEGHKIYTEHNWTKDYKLSQRWREPLQLFFLKLLSKLSNKIICVSDAVRSFYENNNIAPTDKLVRIYNGVRFFDTHQKKKLGEEIVIGSVGSLVERKNPMMLAKLVKNLREEPKLKEKDVKLILVGEGELKVSLESYIQKHDLSENIIFQKHSQDFWKSIDIYIQSSLDESFGMAIAEAFGSSIPTLASDVGAVSELLDDKYLFGIDKPMELYRKALEIILNYNKIKKDTELKAHSFRKMFSVKRMANDYRNLYLNLFSQPK